MSSLYCGYHTPGRYARASMIVPAFMIEQDELVYWWSNVKLLLKFMYINQWRVVLSDSASVPEYQQGIVYRAPSSDHSLLKPSVSILSDSKGVWGGFLMSGVRMLHLQNKDKYINSNPPIFVYNGSLMGKFWVGKILLKGKSSPDITIISSQSLRVNKVIPTWQWEKCNIMYEFIGAQESIALWSLNGTFSMYLNAALLCVLSENVNVNVHQSRYVSIQMSELWWNLSSDLIELNSIDMFIYSWKQLNNRNLTFQLWANVNLQEQEDPPKKP